MLRNYKYSKKQKMTPGFFSNMSYTLSESRIKLKGNAMNTWMTKDIDMRSAQDIIHRHTEEDESFVSLQEMEITYEGTVVSTRSHWVIVLEQMFEAKYGENKGYTIAQKVITELLMGNEVVH